MASAQVSLLVNAATLCAPYETQTHREMAILVSVTAVATGAV